MDALAGDGDDPRVAALRNRSFDFAQTADRGQPVEDRHLLGVVSVRENLQGTRRAMTTLRVMVAMLVKK